jgi:hypothetical protein
MSLRTPAISLFRLTAERVVQILGNLHPVAILGSLLLFGSAPGCIGNKPANPAATQPVTNVPPETAQPDYWLSQPASAEVTADSFDTLFAAAEAAAHRFWFPIDLRDYRRGLLKTEPVTSKQFFEFWRKDSASFRDVEENSLGPIRRTVYFQFTHNLDGTYTVAPKVLIERMSIVDPQYAPPADQPTESKEPRQYWYSLRRDTILEGKIAASIQEKLRG